MHAEAPQAVVRHAVVEHLVRRTALDFAADDGREHVVDHQTLGVHHRHALHHAAQRVQPGVGGLVHGPLLLRRHVRRGHHVGPRAGTQLHLRLCGNLQLGGHRALRAQQLEYPLGLIVRYDPAARFDVLDYILRHAALAAQLLFGHFLRQARLADGVSKTTHALILRRMSVSHNFKEFAADPAGLILVGNL